MLLEVDVELEKRIPLSVKSEAFQTTLNSMRKCWNVSRAVARNGRGPESKEGSRPHTGGASDK